MIPYGRQSITQADVEAVIEALRSDFLTQGPTIPRFERAVSERVASRHAVAVSSATAALHLTCRALELGPGDRLWTSPITFVASANCAQYCGAEVDFVDISLADYNMDVGALEAKLQNAARDNRLPKIVMPVHFAGASCDMISIKRVCDRYGVTIVEDAAHAVGSTYAGTAVGSCKYSAAAVFSFHPVKVVTTGEGGVITTNDERVAEEIRLLRSHGITRDRSRFQQTDDGGWYYELQQLGYNYRLTDLQAALGCSQLARLDRFIDRRNQLARAYQEQLQDLPLVLPKLSTVNTSAFHLYVVRVDQAKTRVTRRDLYDSLLQHGIGANVHFIPVHLQPYYRRQGFARGDFPNAELYYDTALTLPLFPELSEDQQRFITTSIRRALSG